MQHTLILNRFLLVVCSGAFHRCWIFYGSILTPEYLQFKLDTSLLNNSCPWLRI